MQKVKIQSIFINEKKADGTPYVDKNGKPFKMAVLTSESGNKATMFIGQYQTSALPLIQTWKPGDEVEVIIEKVGEFTNFRLPTKNDMTNLRLEALEKRVQLLEQQKQTEVEAMVRAQGL